MRAKKFAKLLSFVWRKFRDWSCIKNLEWINSHQIPISESFARKTFANKQIFVFRKLQYYPTTPFLCKPETYKHDEAQISAQIMDFF